MVSDDFYFTSHSKDYHCLSCQVKQIYHLLAYFSSIQLVAVADFVTCRSEMLNIVEAKFLASLYY